MARANAKQQAGQPQATGEIKKKGGNRIYGSWSDLQKEMAVYNSLDIWGSSTFKVMTEEGKTYFETCNKRRMGDT